MTQAVEYLTVDQVAAAVQVNRSTIYRMIARNEITATKFGAATRIHVSQIGVQAQIISGVNSGVDA